MSFYFSTKGTDYSFRAGQHAKFMLLNPPFTDEGGNSRTFSFASSPTHKDFIMIATRMRDTAFKNSLAEIPIGTRLQVLPATGFFLLPPQEKPVVFLAGGIGIAPFRSMTEYATESELSHKIYLFYSNKTVSLAAFLADFEKWQDENPSLTVVPTVTEETLVDWKGEKGRISGELVKKYLSNIQEPSYYIAGPDKFVVAVYQMLEGLGVGQEKIKTEEFTGY